MKITLTCIISGAIILSTACNRDNLDIPHAADYTNIYIPQAQNYPDAQNIFIVDTPLTFTYSAYFGGPAAPGSDVTVSFSVNPALTDSFNLQNGTNYPVMPEGSYQLEDSTAVIAANQLTTPLLKISIKTRGQIAVDKSYLLPVTIARVSGNYRISSQMKTLFFLFTGGYAPGEIIHWNDFNAVLPYSKAWIARKPDGELWRYPTDAAGNFGPPVQIASGWDQFDILFNYGNNIIARKLNGNLLSFPVDDQGNIGTAKQIGQGWDIFSAITGYGNSFVAINKTDATLWFYPVDANGNIQQGREIGQGWGAVNPVIGSDNALIARLPGQLLRFPLDANGNFDYGNIRQIGVGIQWDAFNLIFWDNNALAARKPDGSVWLYPVDNNGNVGSPKQIGK